MWIQRKGDWKNERNFKWLNFAAKWNCNNLQSENGKYFTLWIFGLVFRSIDVVNVFFPLCWFDEMCCNVLIFDAFLDASHLTHFPCATFFLSLSLCCPIDWICILDLLNVVRERVKCVSRSQYWNRTMAFTTTTAATSIYWMLFRPYKLKSGCLPKFSSSHSCVRAYFLLPHFSMWCI